MDRGRRVSLFSFGVKRNKSKSNGKIDSVKDGIDIIRYSSVVINESFFLVGGQYTAEKLPVGTIARLDAATWSWSNAGQLNIARSLHAAIWTMSKLIVVGGKGDEKRTEFCQLTNNRFNCVEQKSKLQGYLSNPLLFLVSDDYRNC